MTPYCRACGTQHEVGFRGEYTLEALKVDATPAWLDGICNECLHEIARYIPDDPDGDPVRPVQENDLLKHLAAVTQVLAARSVERLSIHACEVLQGMRMLGDHDYQCRQYARYQHNGRRICGHCQRRLKHGSKLAFVGESQFTARPFVIWARSGDELVAEAQRIAAALDARQAA